MVSTQDRVQMRKDLVARGYHHDYLDQWQPHVAMWWHKPQLNTDKIVVQPVGTQTKPQPGNPDTQLRLSARGILPWPPNDQCVCNYCRARDWDAPVQEPGEAFRIETFPAIESQMVNGLLPPLRGVEQVQGQALSSSELAEKTRTDDTLRLGDKPLSLEALAAKQEAERREAAAREANEKALDEAMNTGSPSQQAEIDELKQQLADLQAKLSEKMERDTAQAEFQPIEHIREPAEPKPAGVVCQICNFNASGATKQGASAVLRKHMRTVHGAE